MGSDIERRSHDATRSYRGLIHQQGRVTLAADGNETREILADEERKELLDIVGPVGTPDDGYKLTVSGAAGDCKICPGTMYVGGIRIELLSEITYFNQPESLDRLVIGFPASGYELIYLWLCEQEVSALEDMALRE